MTGVDDHHLGVYSSHPTFLQIYLDLARQHRLPLRLASAHRFAERGRSDLAEIARAAHADLLAPDQMSGLALDHPERLEADMVNAIRNLKPVVTEYVLHASAPGDELRAIAPDAAARVEAYRLMTTSEPVREAIQAEGIKLVGYRELREAQRAGA